eukprot:TRINITY_DN46976_c0_g1_i1.p1 TRINITY_DN46976_c0_g1~~TRINITY_DN46976_c0_g1_i1.p1  ORF type:complete len:653 (+),score=192.25 TRINITY_DN46976_c0_g1_i1:74-1960(+)
MRPASPLALLLLPLLCSGGCPEGDAGGTCENDAAAGDEEQQVGFFRSPWHETQLFVHNATEAVDPGDGVSVVLHMTVDRLPKLRTWCKAWRGPMSVGVYVRPQDDEAEVLAKLINPGCVRRHADLHVVRGKTARLSRAVDMLTHYPFNVVRNAALSGARTDYVFLLDADFHFRPTGGATLHEHFWPWVRERWAAAPAATEPTVWIVPAFETVTQTVPLPNTTEELREALGLQRCTLFYGHYCIPCHHPTDSLRWRTMPTNGTPYEVHYVESFEPYVIAERRLLPPYDERFIGRGWDKMSYFYELGTMGARFMVLPPPYYLLHQGRGDLPDAKKGAQSGGYSKEYVARQEINQKHWKDFRLDSLVRHGKATEDEIAARKEIVKEEGGDSQKKWIQAEEKVARAAAQALSDDLRTGAQGDPDWRADMLPPVNATEFASASLTASSVCIARRDADEDALLAALQWVCGADEEVVNCSNIRHFPEKLHARADWAFDRWYQGRRDEEGEKACDFGGTAEIVECSTTPQSCVPGDDASEAALQEALEWVCADGLGSCGWTMEGGPHYLPDSLRHHAAVAFTLHYLVYRCAVPAEVLCSFGGSASLRDSPGGWDAVLQPVSDEGAEADPAAGVTE